MARYPNFDPDQRIFNGYAADAFSPERASRWADPRGGYIHAMHRHMWGDYHYIITGKQADGAVDLRRRLAEQSADGHARQVSFRREHLRGTRCPGRMVPGRDDRHALLLCAGRRGHGQGDRRGRAIAPSDRAARHRASPRSVRDYRGTDLPSRGSYLHGQQGADGAQRLDDLSRRRGVLQRHRGLHAGGLFSGPGGRQCGLSSTTPIAASPCGVAISPGPAPMVWRLSAIQRRRETPCSSTVSGRAMRKSTSNPGPRRRISRPTVSSRTA